MSQKKTGLFFGSFNPIHQGHLIIANYFAQYTDLDEVCFVVSPQNPLKKKSSLLNNHHRLTLVNIAIEGNKKLSSSNIEFSLSQPSYTIHTLVCLKEKYPDKNFVLIMGADNLRTFHKWRNYEEIINDYEIYVYPRPGVDAGKFSEHPKVTMVPAPHIELSSTFIRQAIREQKDIRYMLPEKVYQYISEMHFFE